MEEIWTRNTLFLNGARVEYYSEAALEVSVKNLSSELEQEASIYGAWDSYKNLRPGAFRSDLWRLMILWARGGIYLDCDLELKANLTIWFEFECYQPTLYLVRDLERHTPKDRYWNAMMAATPRHKIIEHMLRHVLSNIGEHYYGTDEWATDKWLAITGPRAIAAALESYTGSKNRMSLAAQLFLKDSGGHIPCVKLNGIELVQHSISAQRATLQASAHYVILYKLHLIYCDEVLECTPETQRFLVESYGSLFGRTWNADWETLRSQVAHKWNQFNQFNLFPAFRDFHNQVHGS